MATKPIEVGCLVLVVDGEQKWVGRCGTAAEFLPKGRDVYFTLLQEQFCMPVDGWTVDFPDMEGVVFPAYALRRTDGYDETQEAGQCTRSLIY